ncbi:hypothetical protein TNCV_1348331 [Trichonephila clavipes]|nr:hypothetical protein TNCV_1348331 [Trichonephila clavipes]
MIRWALKLAEFNIEWEHRPGTQNTIADVLSRNPIESIIGEKVNCAIIRARFGAPIKLIIDNGPQFISDILENLSERLGIRHVKTVVYRPQANRTKRVNRDLDWSSPRRSALNGLPPKGGLRLVHIQGEGSCFAGVGGIWDIKYRSLRQAALTAMHDLQGFFCPEAASSYSCKTSHTIAFEILRQQNISQLPGYLVQQM